MKKPHTKNELDVDFIQSRPLTKEEEKSLISKFLKSPIDFSAIEDEFKKDLGENLYSDEVMNFHYEENLNIVNTSTILIVNEKLYHSQIEEDNEEKIKKLKDNNSNIKKYREKEATNMKYLMDRMRKLNFESENLHNKRIELRESIDKDLSEKF
jgi:hypothetical protein